MSAALALDPSLVRCAVLTTLAVLALGLALLAVLALAARIPAVARRRDPERDALRRVTAILEERDADRATLAAAARAAQEAAERASRSRDELVAAVVHGLRAPLAAVLGWARLLRSGRLDAGTAEHAAEALERTAFAQAQLLDDLLDVTRMERGELTLDVCRVELLAVVEAALAEVRPIAEAREIAIAAVLTPAAPPVDGDAGRLQQVIRNLLANALSHTPPGGRIEVRLDRDEDGAVVWVKDTGQGIAPASLPHVFDAHLPSEASLPGARSGLGLAIVRHLVEAHGGTVSATSEGSGGTAFTVRLPASGTLPRPPAGGRSPRIASSAGEGRPGAA